jgi:hypothetical protein
VPGPSPSPHSRFGMCPTSRPSAARPSAQSRHNPGGAEDPLPIVPPAAHVVPPASNLYPHMSRHVALSTTHLIARHGKCELLIYVPASCEDEPPSQPVWPVDSEAAPAKHVTPPPHPVPIRPTPGRPRPGPGATRRGYPAEEHRTCP